MKIRFNRQILYRYSNLIINKVSHIIKDNFDDDALVEIFNSEDGGLLCMSVNSDDSISNIYIKLCDIIELNIVNEELEVEI